MSNIQPMEGRPGEMRTAEQQKKLLHIARAYRTYDITTAIRQRIENLETMVRIMNTTCEDDAWVMYCGADTAVKEWLMDTIEKTYCGNEPQQRAVVLTEEEWVALTTYILITTKHRTSEAETWEKLAAEKCSDGSPSFPKAADNAQFWREMSAKLERIRTQINR